MSAGLTLRFGADTEKAKSTIASLAGAVAGNSLKMASAVKGVAANVETLSASLTTAASVARMAVPALLYITAAVAAYKAVAAAVDAAKDSVDGFNKISNQARQAGVSGTFFQRWTGEAKALSLETEQLVRMLDRAREAATVSIGTGKDGPTSPGLSRIQDNVKAGNLSGADLATYKGAEDQEARIRVVLDLIEKLKTEGRNLAAYDLGKTFFGPEFETQMRNGVAMAQQLKTALASTANAAGGNRIVSEEELQRAREIAAQIVQIETLMSSGLAPIQRDLVSFGQQQYKSWLDIETVLARMVKGAGDLYEQVKLATDKLDEFLGKDPLGSLASNLGADRIRQMLGIPVWGPGATSGEQFGPPIPKGLAGAGIPGTGDRSNNLPAPGAGSTDEGALERYVENMEKALKLAWAEVDTIGRSNQEKAAAEALIKAQAAAQEDYNNKLRSTPSLTDAETASVQHLAETLQRAKDQAADMNQKLREGAQAANFLGQQISTGLADMILEGKSFNDVLDSIRKSLVRAMLDAAIFGGGPLAGIMGLSAPASAGAGASGGLMGAVTGLFKTGHTGGIVGQDLGDGLRRLPLSAFNTAPRLHKGLMPDEFPAVLQKGEAVLTKAQQRAMGGNSSNVSVTIENQNNSRVEMQQRKGPKGLGLRAILREGHRDLLASGELDEDYGRRYGLRPMGR